MYNNTNPAELYNGTTWELLTAGKYIQTGSTALSIGGSNSVSIQKANLPNVKIQVESFNLTRGTMEITGNYRSNWAWLGSHTYSGAFSKVSTRQASGSGHDNVYVDGNFDFTASKSWTGSTSSASPYTTALGNSTPLTIEPSYITLKFWKRLS